MAITQGGAIAYGNNVVTGGGSGGGSGHTILNDAGTSLAQEDDLQFVGTYVSDDSTNGKTKVNIVREFQSVAEIEALTGEAKKGFEVIEDNEEYIPYTGSDILFDNTDTSFEGENVQEVLEEVDSKIDEITEVSTPTMQSVTGVTNQSEVVFIGNILYINIDVIYSTGASEWSNAFVITNINKTLRSSFFGVVINGTGTSPRCVQAYQSGTDITVRLRYPQADQYRGQLVLVFNQ